MKWCCSCIEYRLDWVAWGWISPELRRQQAIPDQKISSLGSCKWSKWFRIWRITLFLCLVCCDYRLSISNDPEHSNQPAFPDDMFSCFSQESMLPPEDPRSFYQPTTSHTNCIYMNPIESTSLLGVQSGEYSPNFDQESVWSSYWSFLSPFLLAMNRTTSWPSQQYTRLILWTLRIMPICGISVDLTCSTNTEVVMVGWMQVSSRQRPSWSPLYEILLFYLNLTYRHLLFMYMATLEVVELHQST